jgi:GlcNAc-P-P-Und epimerase
VKLLITGGSGFIGTHIALRALDANIEWRNLDIQPPISGAASGQWVRADIMDLEGLSTVFREFNPTHVLHLAARTDTRATALADYEVNTIGTMNVLRAASQAEAFERFVFVSSQFVLRPGVQQNSDLHFDPHTTYGESKVVGELLTRSSTGDAAWVIVRPTNVWGPWHPRYPDEFWGVLARGLYVHPSGRETLRTYGYVGNVADQMWASLTLPSSRVAGKVFYLGDPPIKLRDWTDAFSQALLGRPVRTAPASLMRLLALIGDAGMRVGLKAPLTTSRFRSMTEDYVTPTEESIRALGTNGMSLRDGVQETVNWLRRPKSGELP